MAVDTYLQGKKTQSYRRVEHDDITVLIAPAIQRLANEVHLVTKKRLIGSSLVAVIYRDPSCTI